MLVLRHTVKEQSLAEHRTKNFKGTDREWESTLRTLLLGVQPASSDGTHETEMAASITGKKMVISIRQLIAGIAVSRRYYITMARAKYKTFSATTWKPRSATG